MSTTTITEQMEETMDAERTRDIAALRRTIERTEQQLAVWRRELAELVAGPTALFPCDDDADKAEQAVEVRRLAALESLTQAPPADDGSQLPHVEDLSGAHELEAAGMGVHAPGCQCPACC